jgi:hypothetical protein
LSCTLPRRARRFACLLVLLGACTDFGEPRAARRAPRFVIAEPAHDFGRVPQGTAVRHVFEVTNGGDLDLEVIRLRSAKDCTARLLGPSEVAAGGRTAIEAVFETGAVFGPQRRTVTVYGNDPSRPVVTLVLTGEVELEVAARPREVYVGTLRRGERSVRELAVATAEAVRIEGIESRGPHIDIERLSGDRGGNETRLAITAARDAPLGRFTQEVRVRTSSRRFPLLVVPVTGTVRDEGD